MFQLLVRRYIKNYKDISTPQVKEAYAILCGVLGTILNIILFLMKLFSGIFSHSITIIADGFNNLSDAGTTLVSIVGFWAAGYGAGEHHPFGHGRIEWIMGMISSSVVIFTGFELCKTSIHSIGSPERVSLSPVVTVILLLSIFVKLYMYFYNQQTAKLTQSAALQATAGDCISDAASTAAVLLSALIEQYSGFPIDSISGAVVSILIIRTGYKALINTLERIIGKAPDKKMLEYISQAIKSHDCVLAYHDLLIHDCGMGRYIISVRISGKEDQAALLCQIADEITYKVYKDLGCDCFIQPELLVDNPKEVEIVQRKIEDFIRQQDNPDLECSELRIKRTGTQDYALLQITLPTTLQAEEYLILSGLELSVLEAYPTMKVIIKTQLVNDYMKARQRKSR